MSVKRSSFHWRKFPKQSFFVFSRSSKILWHSIFPSTSQSFASLLLRPPNESCFGLEDVGSQHENLCWWRLCFDVCCCRMPVWLDDQPPFTTRSHAWPSPPTLMQIKMPDLNVFSPISGNFHCYHTWAHSHGKYWNRDWMEMIFVSFAGRMRDLDMVLMLTK